MSAQQHPGAPLHKEIVAYFPTAAGTLLPRQGDEWVIQVAGGVTCRRDVAHLIGVDQCDQDERMEAGDISEKEFELF